MNNHERIRSFGLVLTILVSLAFSACSNSNSPSQPAVNRDEPTIVVPAPRIALNETEDPKTLPEMPNFSQDWPDWKLILESLRSGTKRVEFMGSLYELHSEKVEDSGLFIQGEVALIDFRHVSDADRRLIICVRVKAKEDDPDGFLDSMILEQRKLDGVWKDHGFKISHHFDGEHEELENRNGKPDGRQISFYPSGQRSWVRHWKDGQMDNGKPWVWFREDGSVAGHFLDK